MPIPAFLLAATKLPFIGGILRHFAPNMRLVIEYILIGVLLVVAGVTINLWFAKVALSKANSELTARVAVNESLLKIQEQSIASLKSARSQDVDAIRALEAENYRLDAEYNSHRKRVAQLEKENAQIRTYLSGRIPPELACVLNRTCPDGDKGGSDPPKRKPVVLL